MVIATNIISCILDHFDDKGSDFLSDVRESWTTENKSLNQIIGIVVMVLPSVDAQHLKPFFLFKIAC